MCTNYWYKQFFADVSTHRYLYKIGSASVIGNESVSYSFYRDGGVIAGIVIGVLLTVACLWFCIFTGAAQVSCG